MIIENVEKYANRMLELIEDLELCVKYKENFLSRINSLKENFKNKKISKEIYQKRLAGILKGKSEKEWITYYDNTYENLLDEISRLNDLIASQLIPVKKVEKVKKKVKVPEAEKPEEIKKELAKGEILTLDKKTKMRFMKELNIDPEYLKKLIKRREEARAKEARIGYSLYETHPYGKIANRFFEKITLRLTKKYPQFFQKLYNDLKASGLKVLSKTYISMSLFSSLISFILVSILASAFLKHPNIIVQIIRGVIIGIFGGGITFVIFYFYPGSVAGQKEKAMRAELPFVIVHMAAVAGSGAKPISMFTTVLASGEYPSLSDEIKKIVNYVNLFGYSLTTALKTVAKTTPCVKFKDLLDGIVTTVESGGSLKEYLNAVADDALNTYKLERKKWVDQISTYSDLYTGILIAAPLLFMMTLVILQALGTTTLAGLSIKVIALLGSVVGIPALNLGFMFFLNIIKPK